MTRATAAGLDPADRARSRAGGDRPQLRTPGSGISAPSSGSPTARSRPSWPTSRPPVTSPGPGPARRTRYSVNHDSLFRHSAQEGLRVGPFLELLGVTGDDSGPSPRRPRPRRRPGSQPGPRPRQAGQDPGPRGWQRARGNLRWSVRAASGVGDVPEQQRRGHRADPARHRAERARDLGHPRVDVAGQAAVRRWRWCPRRSPWRPAPRAPGRSARPGPRRRPGRRPAW